MIGLDYIMKVYNGTYKQLASKLEIAPPTIMAWLSKKRPIPKAKLETLSKWFQIDEIYFTKELNEVEKIQIQADYLRRLSKRDRFEITDTHTDDDGTEYEYVRWVDPYEDERRLLHQELAIETVILQLRSALYQERYEQQLHNGSSPILVTLERIATLYGGSVTDSWDDTRKQAWQRLQADRKTALDSLLYYMTVPQDGFGPFLRGKDILDDDLFDLTEKHQLQCPIDQTNTEGSDAD
ncbi:hypothetical protein [Paenibacillus cymbidii]|uniref:hypothetical protein n=1 Tax=Paenibacillus cymbidii TaxID=1639034 RepID=UPI001081F8C5|nr:hypothetical protein [Paenibacillus cymbidii]